MIKIIEKIKNNKKIQYVFIFILCSVLVVFTLFFNVKKQENDTTDEIQQYVTNLENKLTNILNKISGVKSVSVAINVISGNQTVLAMKTTTTEINGKTTTERTPITVNGKTVVVKELYPEISGVLIVCDGVQNLTVLNKVMQATQSLLDIDSNKIKILSAN